MIRKGKLEDQEVIYRLWKELFAFDDGGYTDYFFKHLFRIEDVLVKEVDGVLVACLQRRKHTLMIHDKEIPTSLIVGVMTHPNHRHKGYMRQLMDAVLEEARKEEMFTIIQAYDLNLYTPFGFEPVKGKAMLKYKGNGSTSLEDGYVINDVYDCFIQSMKEENGYFKRDVNYFKQYEEELLAQGMKCKRLLKDEKCVAYALYQEDDIIKCSECMAISDDALYELLNGFSKEVEVVLPIRKVKDVQDIDNTLICIHDVEALCKYTDISKEEAVSFQTDQKKWYLPEWA